MTRSLTTIAITAALAATMETQAIAAPARCLIVGRPEPSVHPSDRLLQDYLANDLANDTWRRRNRQHKKKARR